MHVVIIFAILCFISVTVGIFLNLIINKISYRYKNETISKNLWKLLTILITNLMFVTSYYKIGLNILLLKAAVLDCILIITSFIDYKHQIIPNLLVLITLILGGMFTFIHNISFVNAILGMLTGGGILFLLGLVPGTIGGGDIKFMFALGLFLGVQKAIYSLFFAFIFSSIISVVLLLLGIKRRKEYIPFGPFLAAGSFISFHFF